MEILKDILKLLSNDGVSIIGVGVLFYLILFAQPRESKANRNALKHVCDTFERTLNEERERCDRREELNQKWRHETNSLLTEVKLSTELTRKDIDDVKGSVQTIRDRLNS